MNEPKKNPDINETFDRMRREAQEHTEPPHVSRRRSVVVQYYLIAATIAFLVLAIFAFTSNYFFFDLPLTLELQEATSPWFEALMVFVSWFGYLPQSLLVVALVALVITLYGRRWEATSALIAAGMSLGVNLLVKLLVARPRPAPNLVNVIGDLLDSYSFPSGHVMFYVAFFGFLWFLAYTLLKPGARRTVLLIVTGALVVLVGVSRIYLGRHWFSDVLAGYLLGSVVLIAVIRIYHASASRGG